MSRLSVDPVCMVLVMLGALLFGCASQEAAQAQAGRDLGIAYPAALRSSGIAGRVKVHAVVEAGGTVREVRSLESPHPLMSAEVTKVVMRWRYSVMPQSWIAEYEFEFRP